MIRLVQLGLSLLGYYTHTAAESPHHSLIVMRCGSDSDAAVAAFDADAGQSCGTCEKHDGRWLSCCLTNVGHL